MAYSLRCADTWADCPGEFRTETEDEFMSHVELHARTAHPDMTLDDATVSRVREQVRHS